VLEPIRAATQFLDKSCRQQLLSDCWSPKPFEEMAGIHENSALSGLAELAGVSDPRMNQAMPLLTAFISSVRKVN
jgi:hypothetical protein